jgi:hypothetical protein
MKVANLFEGVKKEIVTLQTRVIRIFKATPIPNIIKVGTGYKVQQGAKQVKDLGLGLTVQMWCGLDDTFDFGELHANPEISAKIRDKMERLRDENVTKKHDAFKAYAKHIFDEIVKLGVIKVGYPRNNVYEYVDAKDADKAFNNAFLSTGFSVRFIWPEDAESGTEFFDYSSTTKINKVIHEELNKLLKSNKYFKASSPNNGIVLPTVGYIQELIKKYPGEFLRHLDVNHGVVVNPQERLEKANITDLQRFAIRVALKNDRAFVRSELQKVFAVIDKKLPGKTQVTFGTVSKGWGDNPEEDAYMRYRQPNYLASFKAKNVYAKKGA